MKVDMNYYRSRPGDFKITESTDGKRATIKYLHVGVNWDDFEARIARGLVVELATGKIVAKPYTKFFNLGQTLMTPELTEEFTTPRLESFTVSEKLDGSLGIAYYYDNDFHFGSTGTPDYQFVDWKAKFEELYPDLVKRFTELTKTYTVLFEVLDPDNAVVIQPKKFEFRLTGMVETETGRDLSRLEILTTLEKYNLFELSSNMTPEYAFDSLADVQEALKDFNGEGFVIRYDDGYRLKMKTEEYVKAHGLMDLFMKKSKKNVIRWVKLYEDGELDDVSAQMKQSAFVDVSDVESWLEEVMVYWTDALNLEENLENYKAGKERKDWFNPKNIETFLTEQNVNGSGYAISYLRAILSASMKGTDVRLPRYQFVVSSILDKQTRVSEDMIAD